jgi:adenylyltransferase/sulfurtransferase
MENRYARHIILPNFSIEGQNKLCESSVLIVGCGGLGNLAAAYLAGSGIGKMGLVDFDHINLTNLHRQVLFKTADVGKSKVSTLAEQLRALNPEIEVDTFSFSLDQSNVHQAIRNYGVLIDCTDNFEVRYILNDACVVQSKPLIYGAVNRYEGQVSVLNHKNLNGSYSPNLRDIFPNQPGFSEVPNCNEVGVLNSVVGVISSMMATETIKVILGEDSLLASKLLIYNGMDHEIHRMKLPLESSSRAAILEDFALKSAGSELNVQPISKSWEDIDTEILNDRMLIDVREEDERNIWKVSSFHVPLNEMERRMNEIMVEDAPIFYCETGVRAKKAASLYSSKTQKPSYYIWGKRIT